MNTWKLQKLPVSFNFETKQVLKSLPSAYFSLAELKRIAASIPDQNILINTLGLLVDNARSPQSTTLRQA